MKLLGVKQNKAVEVGLVLGSVFVIMGFAYSNPAGWILGFILLGLGAALTKKQ